MAGNTTGSDSGCWSGLPPELQLKIFERCTWTTRREANLLAGSHPLATLATVCKTWESFFEGRLFQHLTLRNEADIQTFSRLVQGRRRAHVKWIWLRIELPLYDCQKCRRLETSQEVQVHRAIFTNLVWNLFDVLSKWKNKEVRAGGITLELSAHSPSDMHHFNKDLRFRIDDTACERWDDRPVSPHNDPIHDWKNGRQIRPIPTDAKFRLCGLGLSGVGLRFDYTLSSVRRLHMRLPRVSVVTSFFIRRQFPRIFAAHMSLIPMMRSLTRLSNFSYEPWRGPTFLHRRQLAWASIALVKEVLRARRKTLKSVSIFENHDDIFYRPPRIGLAPPIYVCQLSDALAEQSHNLEELHMANNIDAYIFFVAFNPQAPSANRKRMFWKNLKRLSLSTSELVDGPNKLLILMAARAAEMMPKLQIMELWSYCRRRRQACIFRFRREETAASLELVSTWYTGLTFSPKIKAAWDRVATAHRPLPLSWDEWPWDAGEIEGESSVLSRLESAESLLHPVSLRQIKREDQRRREGGVV